MVRPLALARAVRLSVRAEPRRFWAATLVAAFLVALLVSGSIARANATAARLGSTQPVVVATHDLAAGTEIDADDLSVEYRVSTWVPDDSYRVTTDLLGSIVRTPIIAREAVIASRIAATADVEFTADERGVVIQVPEGMDLSAGVGVELVSTTWSEAVPGRTVSVDEGWATLAVPASDATQTADAIARRDAHLVLRSR